MREELLRPAPESEADCGVAPLSYELSDLPPMKNEMYAVWEADLTYNPDESVGWRDSYDRGRSACYCKDLNSGNLRLIYEY